MNGVYVFVSIHIPALKDWAKDMKEQFSEIPLYLVGYREFSLAKSFTAVYRESSVAQSFTAGSGKTNPKLGGRLRPYKPTEKDYSMDKKEIFICET